MKCILCRHGELLPGTTTVTLERDENTIVFKKVPANVCDNCGESYVDDDITKSLLGMATRAFKEGISVDVRTFVREHARATPLEI